jgi:hypothetical protein
VDRAALVLVLTRYLERARARARGAPRRPFGEHAPEVGERISRLLGLVDGFETPYSLELLATAHVAAHTEPVARTEADVVQRVVGWSPRKARLFTPRHVQLALARLGQEDLLPREWAA